MTSNDAESVSSEQPVPTLEFCRAETEPPLRYMIARPDAPRAPALVVVHGIGRGAELIAETFGTASRDQGYAVIAPRFSERKFDDYQRLGRRGRGGRADLALIQLLDSLAESGEIDGGRIALIGYSGGAQFAHRFAFAHPERVSATAAVAAGWYQWPDPKVAFPYGSRSAACLEDIEFEPDRYLAIPMLVLAGSRDTERDAALRKGGRVDRVQGRNRLERAQRFVNALNEEALARGLQPRAEFRELVGAEHSLASSVRAGLRELALEFVTGFQSRPSRGDDRTGAKEIGEVR